MSQAVNKKVILITGASSGMGKVTAEQLAKEGHIVYGAARRVGHMDELQKIGGHALEVDVTNDHSMTKAVDRVIQEQGRIDVLINNAGFGMYGSIEDTSMEDARYQLDVVLFGLARLSQLVIPHMRDKRSGTIINISSMGGKIYTPLGGWYHAAKHAVEGLSDCMRLELKQFGIDVVVIQPGIIQTAFGDVLMNPMLERTGDGPYKKMAESVASATKASYEKNGGSPPTVISNTISKIINTKKPKTRYVAGKFASMLLFIRKWFGDRAFDKAVMAQVK